jgi:hypothetical protein
MADAVTSNVIYEDAKQYVVHLTSLSDGTGETNVVKVDKSAIGVATDGIEALALDIERVDYTVTGFTSVKITWDHAADSPGLLLTGANTLDYTGLGSRYGASHILRDSIRTGGLKDPKTADSTGDVLLTSSATSGGAYAITLWLRKRPTT